MTTLRYFNKVSAPRLKGLEVYQISGLAGEENKKPAANAAPVVGPRSWLAEHLAAPDRTAPGVTAETHKSLRELFLPFKELLNS
jgi:hypothetical protein